METTTQGDGPRAARESDFIRLGKQVKSIAFTLRGFEGRLAVLEAAAADDRADLLEARQVDEDLAEAVEALLADVTSGR